MEVKDMKNLNDIAQEIKTVQNGVNNMIVPLLKDTIKDANKHNERLFIITISCLIIIAIIGIVSEIQIAKQTKQYADFLSQFEIQGDVIQDLDADNLSSATINDGITINK